MVRRERLQVNGIVQGVGFRPFVFRLAVESGLSGFVANQSTGVMIEIEGTPAALAVFQRRLKEKAPPLARITELRVENVAPTGEVGFHIRPSLRLEDVSTLISPDVAVCTECLDEMFDESDRRFRYPFINCTNCGPRFTILSALPYDRSNTSMKVFQLCTVCAREFQEPGDRRFHAQPNACPVCGPHVQLLDNRGEVLADRDVAVDDAIRYLKAGKIIALRSLGGFHLAVDAQNEKAVQKLRKRKGREEKPLALVAPSLQEIRANCCLSEQEERQLEFPSRPIVLLKKRSSHRIAASVAPGNRRFGFMLPSAPLHYLLLVGQFEALVFTSGNLSEEPIVTSNEEAVCRLGKIADYFLVHDREILQRCDDSIVQVVDQEPRLIRRARGYVPEPLFLNAPTKGRILACGGELKNTIAISRADKVFLSQHIGNLDNPLALGFFEDCIKYLCEVLEVQPEVIAYDMHPEYLSSKWALRQKDLPLVAVQHHHAHLAALLVDNRVEEKIIGIVLDGTGYGLDGTIWGGEVLVGDCSAVERYAWLKPFPLPGGAAAIRQIWRSALSVLIATYGNSVPAQKIPLLEKLDARVTERISEMILKRINAPLTSSCGRLFDAVSAILGICMETTYEAQGAIQLEMVADERETGFYRNALLRLNSKGDLDWRNLISEVVADLGERTPVSMISARFHRTLAEIFVHSAVSARVDLGINKVGLSGGVFQNCYFLGYLSSRLSQEGFEVLTHSEIPANDGGIAVGQIAVTAAMIS